MSNTGFYRPHRRHPPGGDTPLGADTPWKQTPPPGADPTGADIPQEADPLLGGDTPLPLGADPPLRSACWEIRPTNVRNAILLPLKLLK